MQSLRRTATTSQANLSNIFFTSNDIKNACHFEVVSQWLRLRALVVLSLLDRWRRDSGAMGAGDWLKVKLVNNLLPMSDLLHL